MAGLKIFSDENVKASNILERTKEEIQAVLHNQRLHLHHKETHGTSSDIDEHTPLDNFKAPNVFDCAKEEIEALIQTVHPKNESKNHDKMDQSAETREESKAISHKETHGRRDDIDENTRIDEIRGPSIFQRAKEEVEALIGTIQPKNQSLSSNSVSSPEKEGGFGAFIGRGLEKVCSGGFCASIGRGLEKVCSPIKGGKAD